MRNKNTVTRHVIGLLLMFALALGLIQTAAAVEKSVSFRNEAPAGRWMGIRLRNLNAGATLSISLTTNGTINLMLLNSASYGVFSRKPDEAPEPLFQSSASDRVEFSVLSPRTDDYYLIVDNRKGTTPRTFTVEAKASLETPSSSGKLEQWAPKSGDTPDSDEAKSAQKRVDEAFAQLIGNLGKAFKFDRLAIRLVRCNRANAFASQNEVYLCAEFIKVLQGKLQDKNKARDILLFALMHEISHVLFSQWKYPFNDNEEVVDELATVLLLMFNQRSAVETQADFFASVPPEPEIRRQIAHDVHHPISVQRARNLRRWLSEPKLIKKWQSFLIPHMQTDFLTLIEKKNPSWMASDLVDQELAIRRQAENRD
jgi:hypothetical protein